MILKVVCLTTLTTLNLRWKLSFIRHLSLFSLVPVYIMCTVKFYWMNEWIRVTILQNHILSSLSLFHCSYFSRCHSMSDSISSFLPICQYWEVYHSSRTSLMQPDRSMEGRFLRYVHRETCSKQAFSPNQSNSNHRLIKQFLTANWKPH